MKIYSITVTAIPVVFAALLVPDCASAGSAVDNETGNILITAGRVEQPVKKVGSSVSVLTASEIKALGYKNVADILRTLPGIGASNAGGAGGVTALRIRGEESFRTKILIDGVDVSDPTSTQVAPHIEHILSPQIERIEVLRGPQGVAYGADSGGVINIITRKPEAGVQGDLNLEYGRYNARTVSGNVRGATEQFDYSLSATRLETDGFNSRVSDTSNENDGYQNDTYNLNTGWHVSDTTQLRINIRDTHAESEFDNCFDLAFNPSDNCLGKFDQTNYKLSALYNNDDLSHDISVSRTDVDRESYSVGVSSFATDGTIDRFEYSGKTAVSAQSSWVYGAEYKEEAVTPSSGSELERNQKSIYLEWHSSLADDFHYILGARQDDNEDFGQHTSYRVTGNYLAQRTEDGDLTVKGSIGNGFRAPSLSEIAYNNGPDAVLPAKGLQLDEETSEGFDVGLEYRTDSDNFIELVYFDQRIENEIYFDLSGFSGYLQATGDSRSRGVELSGAYHLLPYLRISGSYTYNDTETPDGQQRIRRPRHQFFAALDYLFCDNKARMNIHLRHASDAQDEIFSVGRVNLDDYNVVGMALSYDPTDSIQVYARLENMFDEDYQEVTGFNTAGTAAYIGTRLRF
jgi:vitamin B12 transporter